jgi:hypothetical protein
VKRVAVALLLFSCLHEFAWQLSPSELGLQRDIRDVTQWAMICAFCWSVHVIASNRLLSAVCAAVAVMSSTTALCALWWLFDRSVYQCSATYQGPVMLLSAFAALAVFWRWNDVGER